MKHSSIATLKVYFHCQHEKLKLKLHLPKLQGKNYVVSAGKEKDNANKFCWLLIQWGYLIHNKYMEKFSFPFNDLCRIEHETLETQPVNIYRYFSETNIFICSSKVHTLLVFFWYFMLHY